MRDLVHLESLNYRIMLRSKSEPCHPKIEVGNMTRTTRNPRARRTGRSIGAPQEKSRQLICIPTCSHPRLIEVAPIQIRMTSTDIEHVHLNEDSVLRRCEHCGCVTESWRDAQGERRYRRIGEYDSCASPNRFSIDQSILDEYTCMAQSPHILR